MSGPVSGLPGLGICCSSLFPFLTMTGALAEQNVEVCLVSRRGFFLLKLLGVIDQ